MGWYLDGRVTAVLGSHTHVPTADARLLPKGTAYISDVGMTGPRDSVIGFSPRDGPAALPDPPADPLRGGRRAGQLQRGGGRGGAGHRAGALDQPGPAPDRGLTGGPMAPPPRAAADPAAARPPCVGPTGSGKTDLSLALAARLAGRDPGRRFAAGLPRHGHRHRQARCGRARGGRRTTSSTWSSRRAVHGGRLGRARRVASSRRSRSAAACRWWSGGPACTSDALLDGYAFELPPQPAQRARARRRARGGGRRRRWPTRLAPA